MPIASNNARVSVDFEYEWEAADGEVYRVPVKFLHLQDGPVIQIFDGSSEPIELPAAMFMEVSEFLVKQGVMKSTVAVAQKPQTSNLTMPSIARKRPVAVPQPQQRKIIGQPILKQQSQPVAVMQSAVEEEPETQVVSQEDAGATQLASSIAEPGPPPTITPEQAQKLLQERLAAKARSNATSKRVKSNPKFEGEGQSE